MKRRILEIIFLGVIGVYSTSNVTAQSAEPIYTSAEITDEIWNLPFGGEVLEGKFGAPNTPSETRPLVILIHGGGFMDGDWESTDDYRLQFNKRDYAALSVTYRTVNHLDHACTTLGWWRAIQDVNYWIKYALKMRSQGNSLYQFDPNKIILFGASAGAVTALTLTYTSDADLQQYPEYADEDGLEKWCNIYPTNCVGNYKIIGTFSGAGAIPLISKVPGYDFKENTSIYFLHDINDAVVPSTEGHSNLCSTSVYPFSPYLYGAAHLLADNQFHAGVGVTYNPPPSPEIVTNASTIYPHQYFNHNAPLGPNFPGPHAWVSNLPFIFPSFVHHAFTNSMFYNGITIESIEDWAYHVSTSPILGNNTKSGEVTGVGDIADSEKDISISPNPNNGVFTLSLFASSQQSTKIEVLNTKGQLMHLQEVYFEHGENQVEVNSKLPQGVYFVKINIDAKWLVKKLVVN